MHEMTREERLAAAQLGAALHPGRVRGHAMLPQGTPGDVVQIGERQWVVLSNIPPWSTVYPWGLGHHEPRPLWDVIADIDDILLTCDDGTRIFQE